MIEQGIQPIEILIDQAHRRGIRFIAGFRVNDNHAFIAKQQGVGIAGFIESHPELKLTGTDFPEGDGYASSESLDFTHEAVRDFTHGVVEEFMDQFDVDGIEMCFRDHGYFPVGTGRERAGLMTDLMRRVRAIVARRDAAIGGPRRVGARVYSTLGECLDHGLDVPNRSRRIVRGGCLESPMVAISCGHESPSDHACAAIVAEVRDHGNVVRSADDSSWSAKRCETMPDPATTTTLITRATTVTAMTPSPFHLRHYAKTSALLRPLTINAGGGTRTHTPLTGNGF